MIVLIVEDEEGPRLLWKSFLAPVAEEIRTASTIAEAFEEMMKIPPPALVLFDLRLPDSREASDTLRHIEALKKHSPDAVVVVITGAVDEALPMLARQYGADGFAWKPEVCGQEKLFSVIKDSCNSATTEQRISMIERLSSILS